MNLKAVGHLMCKFCFCVFVIDTGDVTQDIGHILDFFTRLHFLHIEGSTEPLGTSNLVNNQLSFHLQHFKSLQKLKVSLQCKINK